MLKDGIRAEQRIVLIDFRGDIQLVAFQTGGKFADDAALKLNFHHLERLFHRAAGIAQIGNLTGSPLFVGEDNFIADFESFFGQIDLVAFAFLALGILAFTLQALLDQDHNQVIHTHRGFKLKEMIVDHFQIILTQMNGFPVILF